MRQNWGYDHYGMFKQTLFGWWDMQAAILFAASRMGF